MSIDTRPNNGREVRGLRVVVTQGDVSGYPIGRNLTAALLGDLPSLEVHSYRVEVFGADGVRVADRSLATQELAEDARAEFIRRARRAPDADVAGVDWQVVLDAIPMP